VRETEVGDTVADRPELGEVVKATVPTKPNSEVTVMGIPVGDPALIVTLVVVVERVKSAPPP
jgi:hypothetical protein